MLILFTVLNKLRNNHDLFLKLKTFIKFTKMFDSSLLGKLMLTIAIKLLNLPLDWDHNSPVLVVWGPNATNTLYLKHTCKG